MEREQTERAAEGFQALAHAAQSVAFRTVGAASVVGDFERAQRLIALQGDVATAGFSVTNDVGDSLAQGQRQHAIPAPD